MQPIKISPLLQDSDSLPTYFSSPDHHVHYLLLHFLSFEPFPPTQISKCLCDCAPVSVEPDAYMAEAITIPSPSAFLRSSPPPDPKDTQPPSEAQKHVRKKSVTGPKKKAAVNNVDKTKPKTNDVNRPKQSKSRNGTLSTWTLHALGCLPSSHVLNRVNTQRDTNTDDYQAAERARLDD